MVRLWQTAVEYKRNHEYFAQREIKDSQSNQAMSLSWILAESSNEIYVE